MRQLYPEIYYKNGELYVEDVRLKEVAERVGTPLYVYSRGALEYWFKEFDSAFGEVPHTTCFAVKSNSNVQVLRVLKELGAGADTVSAGEIFRALSAGIDPKKIVFAGVGKREEELLFALERGILMVNVESEGELRALERIAERAGKRAPLSIRVNPDVDPKTHPYISTGLRSSKFGVTFEEALELYKVARDSRWLNPVGIHFHIGSQITDVSVFGVAAKKVADFVRELRSLGLEIEYFDAGGGLGINYKPDEPVVPSESLAGEVVPVVKDLGCHLILEPGRRISGNSGVLVAQVLYVKERGKKVFYIVDAGMNDLPRTSLYNAYHHIVPLEEREGEKVTADVVGPICETGDVLARERRLPPLKEGDLIAVLSAGAYGFTMASNYNSRPRPPEVLVEGGEFRVIRDRERIGDLIAREELL